MHRAICNFPQSLKKGQFSYTELIEMANPGEVSQILSGITFDRNNIFSCGKKLLMVLKITCMWLLSSSKNIVPIKSYATFKSSKFATLPQDLYKSASFPDGILLVK